jgi:hypothetical protein
MGTKWKTLAIFAKVRRLLRGFSDGYLEKKKALKIEPRE